MFFRPRATTVNTDVPLGSSEMGSDSDFTFAFNNDNFSNRLLKIEIVPDLAESKTNAHGCTTIVDWAHNRKRRKEEIKKENVVRVFIQREEQILTCDIPDTDDAVAYENQDEEATTMVEELPSDVRLNLNQDEDEAAQSSNSPWNMDGSTILRVNTIHISSPILAGKSSFFYKLFSNGTKESENRHVTLRIHASAEEAAFLDLLRFIYGNTLSATCPTALLDVLLAAAKFEVASCMRHCSILLRSYSMTCESALLYLDLPYSVLMAKEVLPLADTAKQFLAAHHKDISKFQGEVLNLPLAGIEAVLSSDDLLVASEDIVCEFVLKWARAHYHK
ncbi:hypothetical protein HS088_TW20G00416 [Tripterygium wilfordii]|uniref:BTB domain-containing protein n=1 Tax=Tripterygium wilfordii TaxID=458696 RepID=A0A7J7C8G8_TRIWF|nr:hypothetical protein HS088_TW20G00416 [Tripterygium wilfordii]